MIDMTLKDDHQKDDDIKRFLVIQWKKMGSNGKKREQGWTKYIRPPSILRDTNCNH